MNVVPIVRTAGNARMSKMVRAGNLLFLAGQTSSGAPHAHTIEEQATEALGRIDTLLEQAGSSRRHLLSVTIYLKDMALFDRMNVVWQDWVDPEHLPARCTVQARLGLPELLVEFSVTAAAS
ncbi:RidA family protein [Paraburkholderia ginsengisoli]|uniref:RidA family protein n=2 Tax=Paraburkholderia ginsengisoli TaxID=311231 RepID=A0A7T4TA67_9BURK|nr:RidA family protein [Paraburkholderia ginsengisoli]